MNDTINLSDCLTCKDCGWIMASCDSGETFYCELCMCKAKE